jgi:hypothetical protein
MFRDSSDDIVEFTISVTCFINKGIGEVIPTVTVTVIPTVIHIPTRSHGLQAKSVLNLRLELPLSRSGSLNQTLIRNPATPSDEPSNSKASI